jgi:hypothetical protein
MNIFSPPAIGRILAAIFLMVGIAGCDSSPLTTSDESAQETLIDERIPQSVNSPDESSSLDSVLVDLGGYDMSTQSDTSCFPLPECP